MRNTFNLDTIKSMEIVKYLSSEGYQPVRKRGEDWWYKSPLRNERTPSFHVNTVKNRWYDFGDGGHGGDIINLVERMHNLGLSGSRKLPQRTTLRYPVRLSPTN